VAQFIPFTPSPVAAPSFLLTLDGQQYTAVITWNLFGRRFYLNVYTLSNVLVLAKAAVGSNLSQPINLVTGYFFTNGLLYDESNSQFIVTP
jgi:hypothetical protein